LEGKWFIDESAIYGIENGRGVLYDRNWPSGVSLVEKCRESKAAFRC